MVLDDDEIEKSRMEDQSGRPSQAKRDAAELRRSRKIIAQKALRAKKANDARAYRENLRLLRIVEGSQEWKNAWKFFYS